MLRFGRRGRFDAAIAHGSTDLPMACRALRVPNTTMFDYEFARLQHSLNCRLANRVLMPDAIPAGGVREYGARGRPSWSRYPGLKEEYYLADFEPDPARAGARSAWTARGSASCCARRPTSRSTTGSRTRCSTSCWHGLGARDDLRAVVLPRTPEQAARIRGLGAAVGAGARAAPSTARACWPAPTWWSARAAP